MRLDVKEKADLRFFMYYFFNGTLNFDLLNNKLNIYHIEYIEMNPELFFEVCCLFVNHKQKKTDQSIINRRVAEYICWKIESDRFTSFENFKDWELNSKIEGKSYLNSLKDFSYKISFDKIPNLTSTNNAFQNTISYGATFWETVFVIWANNLEMKNNIVTNQNYSIDRAVQWFIDKEQLEEWEFQLEL